MARAICVYFYVTFVSSDLLFRFFPCFGDEGLNFVSPCGGFGDGVYGLDAICA